MRIHYSNPFWKVPLSSTEGKTWDPHRAITQLPAVTQPAMCVAEGQSTSWTTTLSQQRVSCLFLNSNTATPLTFGTDSATASCRHEGHLATALSTVILRQITAGSVLMAGGSSTVYQLLLLTHRASKPNITAVALNRLKLLSVTEIQLCSSMHQFARPLTPLGAAPVAVTQHIVAHLSALEATEDKPWDSCFS